MILKSNSSLTLLWPVELSFQNILDDILSDSFSSEDENNVEGDHQGSDRSSITDGNGGHDRAGDDSGRGLSNNFDNLFEGECQKAGRSGQRKRKATSAPKRTISASVLNYKKRHAQDPDKPEEVEFIGEEYKNKFKSFLDLIIQVIDDKILTSVSVFDDKFVLNDFSNWLIESNYMNPNLVVSKKYSLKTYLGHKLKMLRDFKFINFSNDLRKYSVCKKEERLTSEEQQEVMKKRQGSIAS